MDGEKIFCVWYNKEEKYWDKCYNARKVQRIRNLDGKKCWVRYHRGKNYWSLADFFIKLQ